MGEYFMQHGELDIHPNTIALIPCQEGGEKGTKILEVDRERFVPELHLSIVKKAVNTLEAITKEEKMRQKA